MDPEQKAGRADVTDTGEGRLRPAGQTPSGALPAALGQVRTKWPALSNQGWIWSYVGAVALWLSVVIAIGRGAGGTAVAGAIVASFYFIAGSGQMFVIALGNGHIDLSIPYVMTVAGVVAVDVMQGSNAGLALGILAALGAGAAVAVLNVFVVQLLHIEPIIGTLAVGFILQTVALRLTQAVSPPQPSPALSSFTVSSVWGIPVLPVLCGAVAVALGIVAARSTFGSTVTGHGQSAAAAVLAGRRVRKAISGSYFISGVFAAMAGVLLAAYSGGAALDASTPFLLGSIAVVVLGGNSIAGGEISMAGVWGGALFLTFVSTMVSAVGLSAAWQDLAEGMIILLAVSVRRGQAET